MGTILVLIYFLSVINDCDKIFSFIFSDNLSEKPQTLTSVFCWGSGITLPMKLPFPSSETQVIQVATGRTQKAAVTKNGRLFVWEVSLVFYIFLLFS